MTSRPPTFQPLPSSQSHLPASYQALNCELDKLSPTITNIVGIGVRHGGPRVCPQILRDQKFWQNIGRNMTINYTKFGLSRENCMILPEFCSRMHEVCPNCFPRVGSLSWSIIRYSDKSCLSPNLQWSRTPIDDCWMAGVTHRHLIVTVSFSNSSTIRRVVPSVDSSTAAAIMNSTVVGYPGC